MLALKMLLMRVDLSGIAFVLDVTERASCCGCSGGPQSEQIKRASLRDLPVTQVTREM